MTGCNSAVRMEEIARDTAGEGAVTGTAERERAVRRSLDGGQGLRSRDPASPL